MRASRSPVLTCTLAALNVSSQFNIAMKTLILGGARSGKSHYAQQLAQQSGLPVIYVATATADDEEMRLRIEQHQHERPASWQLVEEPLQLASLIQQYNDKQVCLLVDCLTLWMSNQLAYKADGVTQAVDHLLSSVKYFSSELVIVSNEVGMGIVPMGELSRQFVDESGRLHQRLAQECDRVVMTIAGLPQILKDEGK